MKQSLQLKIGQQLTMTPQLQQAIKLLQLSSLDLQEEIQEALDSNMMLEIDETVQDSGDSNEENTFTDPTSHTDSGDDSFTKQIDEVIEKNQSDSLNSNESSSDDFIDTIPNELPSDTSWDEVFDSNAIHTTSSAPKSNSEDYDLLANTSKHGQSIQEHLEEQLELIPLSEIDRQICLTIIDYVDDSGFLSVKTDDVLDDFKEFPDIEKEEIEAMIHLVQSFDPPGIAARDIQECLLIQLNQLNEDVLYRREAIMIIKRFMHLLANRDFVALKRRSKLSEDSLKDVIKLIQSLNPRPAGQISTENTQYVVPDVIVKKINGLWHAELNQESIPPLTINKQYAELAKNLKNSTDAESMKDHLQEARWFIKSIQSRNDTLLKVSRSILDFQQDFFNFGDEYMKALVLADVADAVGMHESTISRVTTQKYMHTPKGVFELKYFFSSHVSTASGGEASATAIRAIIKKIIESENSSKPYSDNKLSQLLAEQNYKVARRTVAKYRESLSIPPSNERKTLL